MHQYSEGEAQVLTARYAKNTSGVISFAGKQAGAVQVPYR